MTLIPVLVPDLPTAEMLLPWLRRIDATHCYTNFGPLVHEFEAALSSQWPAAQVVSFSSGTAALEIGIAVLNLAPASQVLVPAFTFAATASAAVRNGLQPIFSDVAPGTWQLTPDIARRVAQHHALALVIPVATFGCPVDVEAWDAFVEETGIPVLIDAAGAFGNQRIGARASVAFSFHATKPFGIGEGGALVTRDTTLATSVRRLSNFGFENAVVEVLGTNAKLSEYAAAIGLAQWARWPEQKALRQGLWQRYATALRIVPGVRLQQGFAASDLPATLSIGLSAPVAGVVSILAGMGIQTRRWYCPSLQHHPAFARCMTCGPDGDELPVTAYLSEQTVGVPWFAGITPAQCERVVFALQQALGDFE